MDSILHALKAYFSILLPKLLFCAVLAFVSVSSIPIAYSVVYESVPEKQSATEAIDAGLDDRRGGFRKYILNGQKISGKLSSSVYSPHELSSVLNDDWQNKLKKINSENDAYVPDLSVGKPLVSSGDNWSMFANLNLLGRSKKEQEQPTLAERYIVFAIQPDQKSKSDVWILKIPEDVKPLSLMVPASSGGNVPVYPGNTLSWSLVEATQSGESELHIYSGKGVIAEYTDHYRRAYIAQGFGYNAIIQPESSNGDTRLLFSRGRSELDVTLQQTNEGIISIIQLRKKR